MRLSELARQLRENADHLENLENEINIPITDCTIKEAAIALTVHLGLDAYFAITPPEITFSSENGKRKAEQTEPWKVYYDSKLYVGSTLAIAVRECLDKVKGIKDPVREVETALSEPIPF